VTDRVAELTVDLALYRAGSGARDGTVRLVLRRTVCTAPEGPAGVPAAAVEELWVSDELPPPLVRGAVRAALGPVAAPLLLAEPVPVLPGLHRPTHHHLDDLDEPASVGYLAGCRGTVRGAPGARTLAGVEVVGGAGVAGHVARSLLLAAIGGQGMVPDAGLAAGPPAAPPDDEGAAAPEQVRADLLADLADARGRLDEADLWRRVAGGPVGGWAATGPDRFRLVRLAPGPATLTAGPGGPDPDRMLVTFVEAGGGEPALTALVAHRCGDETEPGGALRRAEVVAALGAYTAAAADPGADPAHVGELRRRAVDALGGAAAPRITPAGPAVPALHGTVVLQDSRGIPVGNRVHRFSTTVHLLVPGAPAAALLQDHPELVRAVVEHACVVEERAAAPVQQRLADALGADGVVEDDPRGDPADRITRSLRELGRELVGGARR
jgi:hypothetical protein